MAVIDNAGFDVHKKLAAAVRSKHLTARQALDVEKACGFNAELLGFVAKASLSSKTDFLLAATKATHLKQSPLPEQKPLSEFDKYFAATAGKAKESYSALEARKKLELQNLPKRKVADDFVSYNDFVGIKAEAAVSKPAAPVKAQGRVEQIVSYSAKPEPLLSRALNYLSSWFGGSVAQKPIEVPKQVEVPGIPLQSVQPVSNEQVSKTISSLSEVLDAANSVKISEARAVLNVDALVGKADSAYSRLSSSLSALKSIEIEKPKPPTLPPTGGRKTVGEDLMDIVDSLPKKQPVSAVAMSPVEILDKGGLLPYRVPPVEQWNFKSQDIVYPALEIDVSDVDIEPVYDAVVGENEGTVEAASSKQLPVFHGKAVVPKMQVREPVAQIPLKDVNEMSWSEWANYRLNQASAFLGFGQEIIPEQA